MSGATTRGAVRRLAGMLRGAWHYRDAHYLVAEMDVDARAARRWLPWPLSLAAPATASVFTAWFPDCVFGSVYREAGIFLHVVHFGRPAVFCPWMIVDDDVALVLGRELLGYPKKMGAIDFTIEGDRIRGVASRRGAPLVRMEGMLGDRIASPPPMLGRPHRNVRGGAIVAFTPRERAVEVRHASLEVAIGGSERDPLAELGLGAVRAARLHRVDLGGRIPPLPVGIVSPSWLVRHALFRMQ